MKTLPDIYPGRAEAPSAAYPEGTFKNETIEGSDDGTPVENKWAKQLDAFFQALDARADISPNGNIDSAIDCQRMMAFRMMNNGTTRPPHAYKEEICSNIEITQWQAPGELPNNLMVGQIVIDSCVGWSFVRGKPIILLACADNTVRSIDRPWDYDQALSLSSPLGLTYDETPSHVLGLCSDARYLYVAYRSSITSGIRVSKFDIQNFTGDFLWDVSIGKTIAEGGDAEYVKIIVANQNTLAVSLPSPVSGENIHGVAIVSKVTGTVLVGHGNNITYATSVDPQHYGKLVSDRSHVFWIGKSGTSTLTFYLVSAKINDPTTSDYSLQTLTSGVSASSGNSHIKGLLNVGGPDGVVLVHNPYGEINQFRKLDDASSGVMKITELQTYPAVPDGDYDVMIGSDGLSGWFYLVGHDLANDAPGGVVCKIPLGWFGARRGHSGPTVYDEINPSRVSLDIPGRQEDHPAGKLLFDGRDMWTILRAGVALRICNPMAR